ncbi:MAG: zinc-binding dehydrogenase [Prolixibacteraceae bacterium]|nr:zinc-binding dehydrogenase [Prolixibacteraceae bacterium]MBN2648803.1 zinc-binding dehydrogenase [Prolixibacteraceae bacterium]
MNTKLQMMLQLPKTMKAIVQNGSKEKLQLIELPLPIPAKGEVLIKMHTSPINPSDISLLNGTFATRPDYPLIPGIEGSGTVVKSGGGLIANLRNGKNVACTSTAGHGGTWAEYMVTSAMHVVPFNPKIGFEQASMMLVNPMTAMAFVKMAQQGKHKTIVNNAAASVLGKMLVRLCQNEKINLVNIVRRNDQAGQLLKMGASYVLNSSDTEFYSQLSKLSAQLDARLFFDAIGGEHTSEIIKAMPKGSKIVLYANLSGEAFSADSRTILQGNKSIGGFFLGNYASSQSTLNTLRTISKVKTLLQNELKAEIKQVYDMSQINTAIDVYQQQMTGGKILIRLE